VNFFFILWIAFSGVAQETGAPELQQQSSEQKLPDKENRQGEATANVLDERDKFQFLQKQGDLDIMRHKPIYFAYNNPLTKVQFSFKSPIIEDIPFYFAYSQTIFWKLQAESKPFLDATYNPEFFYRFKFPADRHYSLDLGLFEHNSNGKGGSDSRSYNQTYVRLNYYFEFTDWIVVVAGKLRYIYSLDPQNRDILDYVGPAEFEFRVIQLFRGWVDKGELIVNLNPGGKFADKFDKGGLQIGYDFRLGGVKVVPAFYIQYYTGYGETLVNYNQRVQALRAGFLF